MYSKPQTQTGPLKRGSHPLAAERRHSHTEEAAKWEKKTPESQLQFADAMKSGKVGTAISVLTQTGSKGCLPLDEITNGRTVKEHLLEKHPSGRPLLSPAIEACQPEDAFHPVLFDAVDGSVIRKCALKLRGAAGPSYADSTHWKRMLTEL